MKRSFLSNLIFLLFLNFLVKPFWILGIDRGVQNTVGPAEYGVYFSIFNFSLLFQMLLDFGINNFNNRHISQHPEQLGRYFSTMLFSKLLFAILYSLVAWAVAIGIGYDKMHLQLLGLMILTQIGMSFLSYLRSNIAALHLFRTDAWLSVTDKLFTITLCALMLWTDVLPWEISIQNFILAQIGGYVLGSIFGLFILFSRKINLYWRPDLSLIKQVIRQSAPFAMLTFLMATYYRVDGVMIERMLGDEGPIQAGIYASAYRLLDAMNILGYMFAAILLPSFSKLFHQKKAVQPLMETGLRAIMSLAIPSATVCFFFRHDIMQILYTDSNEHYSAVFGLLMPGFILISMVYIFGTLLTAKGQLRQLNKVAFSGVCINVVLNLILIPTMQAEGAAVATMLTQVLVTLLHILLTYRLPQITRNHPMWRKMGILLLGSISISFLLHELVLLSWPLALLLAWLLSLALSLLIGMLHKADLTPVLATEDV